MGFTSTKKEYSLLQTLPDELIYEINLMARDVHSEQRKKLMRSVRSKGIENIVFGAHIQDPRARVLINTNGTINDLVHQVVIEEFGWHCEAGHVFEIPFGPMVKLRNYFDTQYMLNNYRM